jgi:hypothetical protein
VLTQKWLCWIFCIFTVYTKYSCKSYTVAHSFFSPATSWLSQGRKAATSKCHGRGSMKMWSDSAELPSTHFMIMQKIQRNMWKMHGLIKKNFFHRQRIHTWDFLPHYPYCEEWNHCVRQLGLYVRVQHYTQYPVNKAWKVLSTAKSLTEHCEKKEFSWLQLNGKITKQKITFVMWMEFAVCTFFRFVRKRTKSQGMVKSIEIYLKFLK